MAFRVVILLLLLAPLAWAQPAPRRGARGPAAPATDPVRIAAAQAAESGALKDFAASCSIQLEPLLGQVNPADAERIISLSAGREFGTYFARLKSPDSTQTETLTWLTRQPKLFNTLMLSVTESDAPDRVLEILQALRADQGDKLDEYAELTTAMCVVWDVPSKQAHGTVVPDQDEESRSIQRPRDLMKYYVTMTPRLRMDPRQLPAELAVYLVDNLASPEELLWAQDRYAGRQSIGASFFDLSYDYEALGGRAGLKIGKEPYTLMNLLKYGGVCGDQAYFAAHVARSVGVPATICVGQGAFEGDGHAWIGYLHSRSNHPEWDFEEGRYTENNYWKGRVLDPQTRKPISDSDVALLAQLASTSARDRLLSKALLHSIVVADEAHGPGLLMQAVNLSPGNRNAWLALGELSSKGKLTPKQFNDFSAAVARFAAKRYPDFAFDVLKQSISGRGTMQRISALDDMRKLFSDRPDLLASLRIEQGDLYRKDKRFNEALAAYGDALDKTFLGPIVMEALDHVDPLLRQANALDRLAKVYESVWSKMPRPESTVIVQSTPFYRIGQRYADLLAELKDPVTEQSVRQKLDALTTNVPVLRN